MKKMCRIGVASFITCIFSVFISSCGFNKDEPEPEEVSAVSLYHASPDAPDLDIFVDDQKLNTSPFKYRNNTGYLVFLAGNRNLKFKPSGGTTVAIDTIITLEPDKDFSIFVVDEFERASVIRLFDDPGTAVAGKGKVRLINLSPDSNPIQLKIKDVTLPLTVGQSFKVASNFMDIEANTYHFEIISGGVLVDELPNTQIQSGFYYTILVRGYATPPSGNTNVLESQVLVN